MQKLFDASVLALLRDGIKKGYWTLEDLDKPPQDGENVSTTPKVTKHFRKVIKVSNIKILLGGRHPNQKRRK